MSKVSDAVSSISSVVRRSFAVRRTAWRQRPFEIMRRLNISRDGAEGADYSRGSAFVYLALFVPALTCIIFSNWKYTASVNDTLLLVSSFDSLERFSSLFSNANTNPLQGLFDIFPSGLRLDTVPNIIGRVLFGTGMHVEFFYTFSGVLLAFAVTAMAKTAGLRWGVAVLAGFLMPLLVLPIFGMYPLVEHFYILWPITYYSTAGTVFVTALFWRIDGQSWRRSAVLTAVIIIIILHLSMVQILFITLLAPAMLAMGAGALVGSRTKQELVAKVVCAALIAAALGCAGIFHYLYAIGINTASHVFYLELMDFMLFSRPNLKIILDDVLGVIANPFSYSFKESANIGVLLTPLCQLGAVYLAILGKTREARIFGCTVVVWILGTAFTIALVHNFYYYTGIKYQGPDPRHFVPIFWPYYAICLSVLIFALAEFCIVSISRAWPMVRLGLKYVPHVLVGFLLVGPVVFIAINYILKSISPNLALRGQSIERDLPSFRFYQSNQIVDHLRAEVGVALDREFRGSVLSMPTDYDKDAKPYKAWRRENTFAYTRAYLGNDFGAFGLRHYNIPTLDQETHNVTPQFYLTVRELLSRHGIDSYDKHFAMVTRPNEPMMALLGLRYLISDYELPIGTQRLTMPIPAETLEVLTAQRLYKSPLRVYELAHPNVGNYSPTNVVRAKTAKAAIIAMSSPTFDGRQTVVTDDASIPNNLVAATNATMTVRMGGVAVQASSTGESVLVLPVQYSHCWQIISGSGATLFRANLMLLGVRFTGNAQIELRQMFGPFWHSNCRVTDAADGEKLRLVDAVDAAIEYNKMPGDGINIIPTPEALDSLFASSEIASVEAAQSKNAPVREYTMAARGIYTEHYSVLNIPKLGPGPYTLSMQVRANRTAGVALQIKDAHDNGVIADYFLNAGIAQTNRLGQSEKLHASITKIDDEWQQLTLTSTFSPETGPGYVFVHIGGRGNFAPRGEAATIRGVKLERGETATPYSGLSN